MTLRIVKATDTITVDQIVICGYAFPGLGKTTLGATADSPILLDFDKGIHRAGRRCDHVPIDSWADVASMTAEDFAPFKTVIVDTVGRALDFLSADIISRDPKMGRAGSLTMQGYGRLKSEFSAWLKMVRGFGLDVVLMAHADEQKDGDEMKERIDAQGSSKGEIYKSSDAMFRLAIRNGKRVLLFSPTETAFGKNPAQLEPVSVPPTEQEPHFLANIIATIKSKLNEQTAEQAEVSAILNGWHAEVVAATSSKSVNALIKRAEAIDPRARDNAKKLLWSHAKDHGFVFDKSAGKFTEESTEEKATA